MYISDIGQTDEYQSGIAQKEDNQTNGNFFQGRMFPQNKIIIETLYVNN
jgi:hypothetical protein